MMWYYFQLLCCRHDAAQSAMHAFQMQGKVILLLKEVCDQKAKVDEDLEGAVSRNRKLLGLWLVLFSVDTKV